MAGISIFAYVAVVAAGITGVQGVHPHMCAFRMHTHEAVICIGRRISPTSLQYTYILPPPPTLAQYMLTSVQWYGRCCMTCPPVSGSRGVYRYRVLCAAIGWMCTKQSNPIADPPCNPAAGTYIQQERYPVF